MESQQSRDLQKQSSPPSMERSRAGCHLPTHTNHLVHVKAGIPNYSVMAGFSDCKCQSSLTFQSVRSLQIIQSSLGWSSILDSLTTDSN
eukprot:6438264-Amphidinium_carterae.1